jgi:lipoyl-dependent peroxiredoxin
MKSIYTAIATASGRDGRAVSSDSKLDVTLSRPAELGGDGKGTNPEQLFAAGYAACFASALNLVAGRQNVDVSDAAVTAEVGLGPNDSGGFGLAVTLRVELPDRVPADTGRELIDTAHRVCPYSNATRGNVPVDIVQE